MEVLYVVLVHSICCAICVDAVNTWIYMEFEWRRHVMCVCVCACVSTEVGTHGTRFGFFFPALSSLYHTAAAVK